MAYAIGSFMSKEEGSLFQRAGPLFGIGTSDNNASNYTNAKYGFSLELPEGTKTSEFQEGEYGDMLLFGDFQIFVSEFDEPGIVTPERIKQDLPAIYIDQPQQVIIGKDRLNALIFFSEEESLGRTREVWFVHNGYLYQISTLEENDAFIGGILETLEFQEN